MISVLSQCCDRVFNIGVHLAVQRQWTQVGELSVGSKRLVVATNLPLTAGLSPDVIRLAHERLRVPAVNSVAANSNQ